jgi:uncharacterized membrane-anchored protein
MSMNLGYLVSTAIFAAIFLVAVTSQIRAQRFHPALYWVTIIATTTVGTTLADFSDRSLGIGYAGGAALLFCALMASLLIWYRAMGSVAIDTVNTPKVEMFYWVTIMFSQTLGTACVGRVEQQAVREARAPAGGQSPVLALDVVDHGGAGPRKQRRHGTVLNITSLEAPRV